LERALAYPDQYEILEQDEAGNYRGEDGEILVAAPVAPAAEPVKLVIKGKSRQLTPDEIAKQNEDDF
jgi:hypothetical protein